MGGIKNPTLEDKVEDGAEERREIRRKEMEAKEKNMALEERREVRRMEMDREESDKDRELEIERT